MNLIMKKEMFVEKRDIKIDWKKSLVYSIYIVKSEPNPLINSTLMEQIDIKEHISATEDILNNPGVLKDNSEISLKDI